jgi:hypothetical protein
MGYVPSVYKGFESVVHENAPGFVAIFLAITLAAPLLAATNAPMDLVIVGFGLWEAWKLSRGLPLTLDGPYRAAPATGPAAG